MSRPFFKLLAVLAVLPVSALAQGDGPPENATQLMDGVYSVVLEAGDGSNPEKSGQVVRVHMNAWNASGEQVSNGEEGITTFVYDAIGRALPAVQKALANASPGDLIAVWISADALFENNRYFEVEDHRVEIRVIDVVAPVPAPLDVAAPPADARILSDGTAIVILDNNENGEQPFVEDQIEVHYSGWTTDGVMFDSTRLREGTAKFPLNLLIGGWQTALPVMHEGETALIWIPGPQAYGNREDRPFSPKGMLVFEVELVAVWESDESEAE